jgi:YbgC/YbaW family acyl-CoA thioester hydrolase
LNTGAPAESTSMHNEIFESLHKVRTFECDFYGHVNNAIYLNYLEFARMEVLEKKGLTLTSLKKNGFMIVIRKVEIRFKFPAMAGDQLVIRTTLKECLRKEPRMKNQLPKRM